MNKKLVLKTLGAILLIEALAILPSYLISLIYQDAGDGEALLKTMVLLAVIGFPMWFFAKPEQKNLRAREGFFIVALAWIFLSVFGALPLFFSGFIPNYVDALFEAVSGFTTTGATVVCNFENYPHGVMFWRSFTHWIGGMGVLVLTLALLPEMTGRTAHLVRAESPGPSLSKIVPKMGDSAKILYIIYALLTVLMFVILLIAGMNPYDAALHAVSTAGTGGFSNYASSVGAFDSAWIEGIITFFMVLFGINFALFFRAITGHGREFLHSEELKWYLGMYLGAVALITVLIMPQYKNILTALRYSTFQVASIMSTTGYATADFNLWPQAVKGIMLMLMMVGACAGSTAGGMKTIRAALLCKMGLREIRHTFQPRKVQVMRFEGKGVDENLLHQVAVFFFVFILLIFFGTVLISLDNRFDFETNFSAAVTCISNVGPGFSSVGAVENFSGYSAFSKIILCVLMLAGRLELFPILVLFHPAIWQKA